MAITQPSRSADLSQLSLSRVSVGSNGVTFLPSTLTKQSRQGKQICDFYFPAFPEDSLLCQVTTLEIYKSKTHGLRGEEERLFVSFIKPHKAAMSSTIARWIKMTLEQSGIDISIFGAHSICGTSASAAAVVGITTAEHTQTCKLELGVSISNILP